ncbi:hypothetical protein KSB_76500 [Ktedonobacter robiniae]|uniref:Transposase n=1 Tax=Ktedonobacter robiniae TaxID=2778365 RepID=A0ABQ3V2Q5_9CHLR|nr:hypothetical protein KSB_76500 [Ktedonobacter robiniae]
MGDVISIVSYRVYQMRSRKETWLLEAKKRRRPVVPCEEDSLLDVPGYASLNLTEHAVAM